MKVYKSKLKRKVWYFLKSFPPPERYALGLETLLTSLWCILKRGCVYHVAINSVKSCSVCELKVK